MIEGPLSGKSESDSASAVDLAALAVEVSTKASGSGLTIAEADIATHTGQIVSLNASVNNMGNSFYTKSIADALLSGKQATLANQGGSGVPMLNGTDVRQVTAVAPLTAAIVYDFANQSDPNNGNLELTVDLSGKQDTVLDGDLSLSQTNGL